MEGIEEDVLDDADDGPRRPFEVDRLAERLLRQGVASLPRARLADEDLVAVIGFGGSVIKDVTLRETSPAAAAMAP